VVIRFLDTPGRISAGRRSWPTPAVPSPTLAPHHRARRGQRGEWHRREAPGIGIRHGV